MQKTSGLKKFKNFWGLGGMLLLSFLVFNVGSAWALKGGDRFGYKFIDSRESDLAFEYENIEKDSFDYRFDNYNGSFFDHPESEMRNKLGTAIDIGFDFDFYGTSYDAVYLASNGYLIFKPDEYRSYSYDGSGMPSKNQPNGIIAPFWGLHKTFD
jgi:hypothetical protein